MSLLIGIVAGLRRMTAPAAASWAAYVGWLPVDYTRLAFMGSRWTALILTALAIVELITDQLPTTPSRKVPVQFGARIVSGALSGATIGTAMDEALIGAIAGILGAIAGTFGGAAGRARLAQAFGRDLPAALTEDAIAIAAAFLIVRVAALIVRMAA